MTIVRSYAVTNARVEKSDGTSSTAVSPKDLRLTFDKSWAPYIQAEATLANLTAAQLAAIDPRTGFRFRFTLSQTDPAGVVSSQALDLGLRSREQSWLTGDVRVTAASDEAVLQDFGYLTTWDPTGLLSSPYNASDITAVTVQNILGKSVQFDTLPAPDITVAAADVPINPGSTTWDYVQQLAEAANAWLWVDEAGFPHWTTPTYRVVATTFTLSDADAVIDVTDTISRDAPDWATAVLIAYAGNTPTAYLSSDAGVTPRKTVVLNRAGRKPANGSATKSRTQAQAHGRSLVVQATADIRARPNQTWAVSWLGQTATGTVQSVTFSLPDGLMTLQVNI